MQAPRWSGGATARSPYLCLAVFWSHFEQVSAAPADESDFARLLRPGDTVPLLRVLVVAEYVRLEGGSDHFIHGEAEASVRGKSLT